MTAGIRGLPGRDSALRLDNMLVHEESRQWSQCL